jgi:hypothetical protein
MATSRLQEAEDGRYTHLVAMDQASFVSFQGRRRCIGTSDLNSCTVVMIVSQLGAILAHISPNPNTDLSNLSAGDQHLERLMNDVAHLYNQYSSHFPQGRKSWVVSAVYQSEIALPGQIEIIGRTFRRLGLTYKTAYYDVLDSDAPRGPAKGTVFIDGRGPEPLIYVEDQLVDPTAPPPPSHSTPLSRVQPQTQGYYPPPTSHSALDSRVQQQAQSYYPLPTSHSTLDSRAQQQAQGQPPPPVEVSSTRAVSDNKRGREILYNGSKYFIPDTRWKPGTINGRSVLHCQELNVYISQESHQPPPMQSYYIAQDNIAEEVARDFITRNHGGGAHVSTGLSNVCSKSVSAPTLKLMSASTGTPVLSYIPPGNQPLTKSQQ